MLGGARVALGNFVSVTNYYGKVEFNHLAFGNYTLTASRVGFLNYNNSSYVEINSLTHSAKMITLTPVSYGNAYFTSNIPAKVYGASITEGLVLNSYYLGETPLLVNQIGIGQKQVYINRTDNRKIGIIKTFDVAEGQTTNVDAIFAP